MGKFVHENPTSGEALAGKDEVARRRGRGDGRVLSRAWLVRGSYVMIGMINSATMLATLIMGLIAGPAVSL
jgi:hypothetical protein